MAGIYFKAFVLQKDGEPFTCQDRIGIDLQKGRFSVADGVSNSFHPEIAAEAVTRAFITAECDITEWENHFIDVASLQISDEWNREVNEIESELDDFDSEHEKLQRQYLPSGASTFAGIEINNVLHQIAFQIAGDSCLFILNENNPLQTYCSNPFEQRGDIRYCLFNNHTSAVAVGKYPEELEWISGRTSIAKGYVMLMTDGAAKWFQDAVITDKDVADQLWNLSSHQAFVDFVMSCRQQRQMDDDIAIIMLKFNEQWNGYAEPLIIDVWEWYPHDLLLLEQENTHPAVPEPTIVPESAIVPEDEIPEENSQEETGVIIAPIIQLSRFDKFVNAICKIWTKIFGRQVER